MRKPILLAGIAMVIAGIAALGTSFAGAATSGLGRPVEFSLLLKTSEPGWASFTLAPRSMNSISDAVAAGSGAIEDAYNTAWGDGALLNVLPNPSMSQGIFNTAVGNNALYSNTSGGYNTACGSFALDANTTGTANVALGNGALSSNTTASGNTAIGHSALGANTTGFANMAIGEAALYWNTIGEFNAASGVYALFSNTEGKFNTASGYMALYNNTKGGWNTAGGNGALRGNTEGSLNTACGVDALRSNTTGINNTAVGVSAGYQCTTGSYNIYLGSGVMGDAADTNTIRIGNYYLENLTPPQGQNRTFVAGIYDSPLSAGDQPAVVGVTSQGRLGTLSDALLPPGPPGPQGEQGPPGPGLVPGSLLFLRSGYTPPTGYVLLGSYSYTLQAKGAKPTVISVGVYQKQ